VRHKADLASLICRTRSDQTVVLKHKSRVELGLKSKKTFCEDYCCTVVKQIYEHAAYHSTVCPANTVPDLGVSIDNDLGAATHVR